MAAPSRTRAIYADEDQYVETREPDKQPEATEPIVEAPVSEPVVDAVEDPSLKTYVTEPKIEGMEVPCSEIHVTEPKIESMEVPCLEIHVTEPMVEGMEDPSSEAPVTGPMVEGIEDPGWETPDSLEVPIKRRRIQPNLTVKQWAYSGKQILDSVKLLFIVITAVAIHSAGRKLGPSDEDEREKRKKKNTAGASQEIEYSIELSKSENQVEGKLWLGNDAEMSIPFSIEQHEMETQGTSCLTLKGGLKIRNYGENSIDFVIELLKNQNQEETENDNRVKGRLWLGKDDEDPIEFVIEQPESENQVKGSLQHTKLYEDPIKFFIELQTSENQGELIFIGKGKMDVPEDCDEDSDDFIEPPETENTDRRESEKTGRETLNELVEKMKMDHYVTSKLTPGDILSIGKSDDQDNTVEHLPLTYLRKLMALNRTARESLGDACLLPTDDDDIHDLIEDIDEDNNSSASINPHDVLYVLFCCSDSLMQQEIVTKMSMCQFAVPLLLPASDGSHFTIMLWTMRDIVKRWRPQSLTDSKAYKEENLVNINMPVFSFVRLGASKLSKSKILNQVLNPAQLHNDFFIHEDMVGGNTERKISDGLVEMSWYFPCGTSDVFPEPIAVANLRGNLESHGHQFTFLSRVSSAVFIFIESISEKQFTQLSKCRDTDTPYFFIVTPGPGKNVNIQTKETLRKLQAAEAIKKANVIIHTGRANEATFVKKLQSKMLHLQSSNIKRISMINLEKEVCGLQIHADEKIPECQKAREHAQGITKEIKNVAEYKNKTMILQGDLWKELSKVEKELCRMNKQGGKDSEHYQQELRDKHTSLHEKQFQHGLSHGIMLFIDSITHFNRIEKQYFLKWLKFELDLIARSQLSELQAQYKEKSKDMVNNKEALLKIDKKISDSSLGIEHFIREMAQFYEAEFFMVEEKKITKSQRQLTSLPGMAADLLLDGFPLELVDGDASNIPLQWITDVLKNLDVKTGGKCRMRVITVLGVQSTGKSTLLNTMFGLQFPVASGRCTRGAFMTLLKVKENCQKDFDCQFIMVIDTEGLKAPELASLEDSYEHDNELATLVVGLSDITIVNMAMENTAEMKDILQIVVHAFLRMNEVGKKPNCQFVHQNVSDVSAHENNMRDRQKLLEQLNEMTRVAAKMEGKSVITAFSDVIDYNLHKDNCYIPGLWLGVPPMASVNSGYSEQVYELKKQLLQNMNKKNSRNRPFTIPQFIKWIGNLWKAVKHEKFIFSFRNSLVAEAYNKLSMQYSQWEWDFRKAVHEWLIRTENNIKNQPAESFNKDWNITLRNELADLLNKEKNKMIALLEKYFESNNENVHLIERYKEDFALNIESLNKDLERNALRKYNEAVSIQKGKSKIKDMESRSQKLIEDKIEDLLKKCKNKTQRLNDEKLRMEFESMWKETLTELKLENIETCNVSKSVLQQLNKDMNNKGPGVNEKLRNVTDLEMSTRSGFKMNDKYVERGWFPSLFKDNKQPKSKLKDFATSLIGKCDGFVTEKVRTAGDYNETYSLEILHMINTELNSQKKNLHCTSLFELDLKLHILGKASREFQKMQNNFITENDPKLSLEKLRPKYLAIFINNFQNKDLCQTKAKEFCEQCLKPAMMDYIFQHLGQEMVDDIKGSSDNKKFSSRTFFQSSLLRELLEENSFMKYKEYIRNYETYTKEWILKYIINKYEESSALKPLQVKKLSLITNTLRTVIGDVRCVKSPSVSAFLDSVCEMLKTELAIPQNDMKVVAFKNKADVEQFSSDILSFLEETETQILSELQSMSVRSLLDKVTVNPEDELLRSLVGCGKQCPFCKVPCEAGGMEHKEHFATIHRPRGLGGYVRATDDILVTDICSTGVKSTQEFQNSKTEFKPHPYKEYRKYYPDWCIQPDESLEASDHWKYVFVLFNDQFAEIYDAKPAILPDGWKNITKENAILSLNKAFNE